MTPEDRYATTIVADRYTTLKQCIEDAFVGQFKDYAAPSIPELLDERVRAIWDEVSAFKAGAIAVASCIGDYFTPDVVGETIESLENSLLSHIKRPYGL
jgi:hypothetical protein